MILISLSGKKHSGKSTVANMISEYIGHECFIVGWADALKDEVCKATGVSRLQMETQKSRFRLLLQAWGTDFRRKENPNYWINKVQAQIAVCDKPLMVIHDTRFINEYEYIKNLGGYLIGVTRPSESGVLDTHQSENDLAGIKFDRVLVNGGSMEDLQRKVEQLMRDLKIERTIKNDSYTSRM